MTSSELMIYDWCYMRKKDTEEWYTSMCFHTSDSDFLDYAGIPLDGDILKKNEWKGTALYWSHKDVPFEVFINIGDGKPFINGHGKVCFDFRYVHQLQHALRLCGCADIANHFKMI